jgi:hypothetical protein
MYLEHVVFTAIEHHTEDKPANLINIIATVDARERIAITYDELEGCLSDLYAQNRIGQVSVTQYYELKDDEENCKPFKPIKESDYTNALNQYREMVDEFLFKLERGEFDEEDDKFGYRKVIVRWKLAHGDSPIDEDEDEVDAFAWKLDEALAKSGCAEINGYEYGKGYIDILIFGNKTNENTEEAYQSIIEIYRAYKVPKGSHIIRYYVKNGKEKAKISDRT